MAVEIGYRKDLGLWEVHSFADTKAEAFAKAAKIEEVNADAFKPLPVIAPEIAHADGHTADGGGITPYDIAMAPPALNVDGAEIES